jgi:hypothetical protein
MEVRRRKAQVLRDATERAGTRQGKSAKRKAELQKSHRVQRSAGRVTGSKGKILFERKELRGESQWMGVLHGAVYIHEKKLGAT